MCFVSVYSPISASSEGSGALWRVETLMVWDQTCSMFVCAVCVSGKRSVFVVDWFVLFLALVHMGSCFFGPYAISSLITRLVLLPAKKDTSLV